MNSFGAKHTWQDTLIRVLVITVSSLIIALNLKSFVQAGDLFPGGFTGLTRLIQRIVLENFGMELPFSPINLTLNAIPAGISFVLVGKRFTLYSCLSIALTSIFTDLVPSIAITEDILLICIFGGLINGFAISLCLRGRATSGGTDFISIALSQQYDVDAWNYIFMGNVVMLAVSGALFGWDKALYSIIYQYASTQVLHTLYKKYQQQTLFIVTNHPRAVCDAISQVSHHGATILQGEGSYELEERNMVYSVVSSAESKHVIKAVREVDEHAFINAIKTSQLSGRFYQKPED